jgi:hypothetical protein
MPRKTYRWWNSATPRGFVGGCLLQGWRWRQCVPPKRWCPLTNPHGVATQKTKIDIFSVVKTSTIMQIGTDNQGADKRHLRGLLGTQVRRAHRDDQILQKENYE